MVFDETFYRELENRVSEYGLMLLNAEDPHHYSSDFVCGPANPNFCWELSDFRCSALSRASLKELSMQLLYKLDLGKGEQLDLFSFYSDFSIEEIAAAFLFIYNDKYP